MLGDRHGLLGLVRMFGPGVDVEFAVHLLAELCLGEHTGDGQLDHADGTGSAR